MFFVCFFFFYRIFTHMIVIAAEVERHWTVEIFTSPWSCNLMESFTKLPAVPCGLCQRRKQVQIFSQNFDRIQLTVNKVRFLKYTYLGENCSLGFVVKKRISGLERQYSSEGTYLHGDYLGLSSRTVLVLLNIAKSDPGCRARSKP